MRQDVDVQFALQSPVNIDVVREHVKACSRFIPYWCDTLIVEEGPPTGGEGSREAAGAFSRPEYKCAVIRIQPTFYAMAHEDQRHCICHEMIHVAHGKIMNFMGNKLIDPLREENPRLHEYLNDHFHDLIEEFTETMANGLGREFEGK